MYNATFSACSWYATVCSVTPCSEEVDKELLRVKALLSDSVLFKYKARYE